MAVAAGKVYNIDVQDTSILVSSSIHPHLVFGEMLSWKTII